MLLLTAHCGSSSTLEKRAEARRLSTELQAEFTHAVDAANRAVMADADEASKSDADEAQRARAQVTRRTAPLATLLDELEYREEQKILEDFRAQFAAYEVLDQSILDLAVENTNLKAMRLSYGPERDAIEAVVAALGTAADTVKADKSWQVRALTFQAIAALREVQALEAPHIAEPDDELMTRLEQRMDECIAQVERAIAELEKEAPEGAAKLAEAKQALARVHELHAEVVKLSRKNTDVRSLSMTLGQKRRLTSTCEEALRALNEALAKRMAPGTR